MVAVGVAVIVGVILVTGGVVAESTTPDTLAFFGVIVRTTSAQVFLTGAICTWALLAAAWLLSTGIRRSRERGEQLAALKARGRDCADRSDPVQPPTLAELLGFAPTPAQSPAGRVHSDGAAPGEWVAVALGTGEAGTGERGVADRPGLGAGDGGAGAEQDAAEQPPRGQRNRDGNGAVEGVAGA